MYFRLVVALEAKNKEAIITVAKLINLALLVAAASVLKTARELLLALLKETCVIRQEIAGFTSA